LDQQSDSDLRFLSTGFHQNARLDPPVKKNL